MIFLRSTGLLIKNPGTIKSLSTKNRAMLRMEEMKGDLRFIIPDRFKTNQEKSVYKIGFLASFLTELYPLDTFDVICEVMANRHHVFLGRRQIERNKNKFNREDKHINE